MAQSKEYLQQQLERSQVLAGYTKPFVRFMQSTHQATVSNSDTHQGSAYWRATINEVDRYVQSKDPDSEVAQLQNLMLKQLRGMNQDNCTDRLDKLPAISTEQSLFAARYAGLAGQVSDYCSSGIYALAQSDYQTLAKRFNSELAGLFPFGPVSLRSIWKPSEPVGKKRTK